METNLVKRLISRPWGLLFPAGALAAFLALNSLDNPRQDDMASQTPTADYELHNSRIDQLDETGRLSLRLITRIARHRPALAGTEVIDVTALQPTEHATPNRLQAPDGFIPDDRTQPMRLGAPVKVEIQNQAGRSPWHLETGELEYIGARQRLASHTTVTVTQGKNRLEAEAFDADLAAGHIILTGQVKARYVP